MMNIKDLRTQLGIGQAEIAERLNIAVQNYSNYETGKTPFPLEDCILIEREFGQRLSWADGLNGQERRSVISAFNALAPFYPVGSIITFLQKWMRQDGKLGRADPTINHFVRISQACDEVLLPPGVNYPP